MPKPLCEAMCCAPVYSLLLSTQNVPAAREGRWSHAGGFGDLTLLHTSYAVRLARAHMFPPGASAEEQAAQGAAWHAVIFWSALFYHLPLLAHLEGELFSGRGWQPGISVPDEAYRFRFRQLPPQGTEAQQLAAVIAGGLLPEGLQPGLRRCRERFRIWPVRSGISIRKWHSSVMYCRSRPVRLKVRC